MRHVIDPKHDLHEIEKQRFAQVVAREIDRVSAEGGFDHLVVVAPAHTLNEIRDALGAAAVAKVVGTLQKDLTKVPDHELPQHLTEWVRYRAEQQNGRRHKTADRVQA
jgi:protein required for attachment to host cells